MVGFPDWQGYAQQTGATIPISTTTLNGTRALGTFNVSEWAGFEADFQAISTPVRIQFDWCTDDTAATIVSTESYDCASNIPIRIRTVCAASAVKISMLATGAGSTVTGGITPNNHSDPPQRASNQASLSSGAAVLVNAGVTSQIQLPTYRGEVYYYFRSTATAWVFSLLTLDYTLAQQGQLFRVTSINDASGRLFFPSRIVRLDITNSDAVNRNFTWEIVGAQ